MKRVWVALALSVALSGCGKINGGNDAICTTPAIYPVGIDKPPVERSKWCVHRWAYKLAQSNEPVGVVADAAIGACLDALEAAQIEKRGDQAKTVETLRREYGDAWAAATLGKDGSLFTGEQITLEAKVHEDLRAEALFRVVQARAGKCNPDV